jgi:hypothetical protein
MFEPRSTEIRLVRHSLSPDERPIAAALAAKIGRGLPLFRNGESTPIPAKGLAGAIAFLLELLARSQTAAVFILDGSEHLSSRQVSALRRRISVPERNAKWLVGSVKDSPPSKARKDRRPATPTTRCQRLLVKTIAPYLVSLQPNKEKMSVGLPILEDRKLPSSELTAATELAVSLLAARFVSASGALPRAIVFVLLDLVTMLARGTTAYLLVLDHDHLADAADPKALDKYTSPALTLAAPSVRIQRKRRLKAERLERVTQLPAALLSNPETR